MPHYKLTRIQEQQEFQANVIADVELEFLQPVDDSGETIGHSGDAEEAEREQVELLTVVQHYLIGQVVVHVLVDVVQHQHIRPRVLQQFHLVVNL